MTNKNRTPKEWRIAHEVYERYERKDCPRNSEYYDKINREIEIRIDHPVLSEIVDTSKKFLDTAFPVVALSLPFIDGFYKGYTGYDTSLNGLSGLDYVTGGVYGAWALSTLKEVSSTSLCGREAHNPGIGFMIPMIGGFIPAAIGLIGWGTGSALKYHLK